MNRIGCVLLLWLFVACEKKEEVAPTPTPTPAATEAAVPATPPAVTEAAVDVEALPVEEDFEAEAEKELRAENLSAKLDEIEQQIDAK